MSLAVRQLVADLQKLTEEQHAAIMRALYARLQLHSVWKRSCFVIVIAAAASLAARAFGATDGAPAWLVGAITWGPVALGGLQAGVCLTLLELARQQLKLADRLGAPASVIEQARKVPGYQL